MLVPIVHLLALATNIQSIVAEPQNVVKGLQEQAMAALRKLEVNGTQSCSISNAAVRKDWEAMTGKEREAYTTAVQCMLSSPSKSDPSHVPGARNRYDDFVGQHINQTLTIHGTGNFLTWVGSCAKAWSTLSDCVSAPTLPPLIRESAERRMLLQGLPAILELVFPPGRSEEVSSLRWLRYKHERRRITRPP